MLAGPLDLLPFDGLVQLEGLRLGRYIQLFFQEALTLFELSYRCCMLAAQLIQENQLPMCPLLEPVEGEPPAAIFDRFRIFFEKQVLLGKLLQHLRKTLSQTFRLKELPLLENSAVWNIKPFQEIMRVKLGSRFQRLLAFGTQVGSLIVQAVTVQAKLPHMPLELGGVQFQGKPGVQSCLLLCDQK